jgi:hypothetical protein
MLTIYLHYVAWAFLNPYLLSEVHLHANAKEALNKVLQKPVHTSTAYALVLINFTDFVEN